MSIDELLDRLIKKTEDDTYSWYSLQGGLYRLPLEKGAVTIDSYTERNTGSFQYIIKLYDQDSCFAVYDSDEHYELYSGMEELYNAINSSFERAREKRIEEVFGNL